MFPTAVSRSAWIILLGRQENAGSNTDTDSSVSEVSGKEDSDGNHVAGPLCDIIAEHLTLFSPLVKISQEAKFQSNGLICLLEKISRQDNLGAAVT